ncbi:tetrahydrobiopterin biosynthesis enzymes-like protein [Mycena maculata]|uniref:dihydroneopterin aldolase n=1 Tax=Mycena maculata TaxID=230809 RepID=A0AAD7K8D9_9AGAR|nr:tetrahydrobiopterin biosynthesis enzymes-like protein [Mycena maculata]
MQDTIIVQDLRVNSTVGPDRWGKVRPQPIVVSIFVEASLVEAGISDDVADSIHYGNLAKDVVKRTQDAAFPDLLQFAESIADLTLNMDEQVSAVDIHAHAKNQFLQAESLGVEIRRTREGDGNSDNFCLIQDLRTTVIIGVNPPEREAKQTVLLNLRFHNLDWGKLVGTQSWQHIHAVLVKAVESTEYLTLEAFVAEVASVACHQIDGVDGVTVRAQKPSALTTAHSSGVQITRYRALLPPR